MTDFQQGVLLGFVMALLPIGLGLALAWAKRTTEQPRRPELVQMMAPRERYLIVLQEDHEETHETIN